MSINTTIITHIENVVTFSTSNITNFTEKDSLNSGFEMMINTWTFWWVRSVGGTSNTVTVMITFFTSIWAR
jgi:hypothetical protein